MKKYLLGLILIILSCANKGALTGGEPDRVAPEIVFSIPQKDTVNVGVKPEFYFKFSERIDRKSFESSIYIVPFLKKRLRFDWDGWDEVTVEFVDSILDTKTYQLIISKGVKDLNGVESNQEYKIAFSRNSNLDKSAVEGQISSREILKNIKVALLNKFNEIIYLGDLSSSNEFSLEFIKPNVYSIVYFEDKNQDLKINFDKERIAISNHKLFLEDRKTIKENVTFFETDTLAPIIDKIDSLYKGVLKLNINDKLDTENSELYFEDSLGRKSFVKKILFKSNQYFGFYNPDLIGFPLTLKYTKIQDIHGNYRDSIKQKLEFTGSNRLDTIPFAVKSIPLKNNDIFKSLYPKITIKFNSFFIWDSTWNAQISLNKGKAKIPLTIVQETADEIQIEPIYELEPSTKYEFNFDTKSIHNYYGKYLKDSIFNYTIYSLSRNRFGSITFNLVSSDNTTVRYRLYQMDTPFDVYKEGELKINEMNQITQIEGGYYFLELYKDINQNNKYDHGKFKPYTLSEPYIYLKDSIPVRSNWDRVLEDIIFD